MKSKKMSILLIGILPTMKFLSLKKEKELNTQWKQIKKFKKKRPSLRKSLGLSMRMSKTKNLRKL
jgi:hypothetical protein